MQINENKQRKSVEEQEWNFFLKNLVEIIERITSYMVNAKYVKQFGRWGGIIARSSPKFK